MSDGNRKREKDRPQFINMIGKKFGRLTVLRIDRSYIYRGKDKVRWWCRCDCGNEGRHGGYELRKGIAKSCGCLSHENRRKNLLMKHDSNNGAIRKLFVAYKYSAVKRNITFEISFEEFKILTSQNCTYCGISPEQIIISGYSEYRYNGIDRVDNNLGYTKDNIITCCKKCNYSKSNFSQDDFYQWAKRVYNNLRKNNII